MKTQKIVLALALVAVTPAVLAAQENGNAYNKSTNEVIAPAPQTASIASFGPEGKLLSLADNTLARIRQNRQERKQHKEQQKQEPVQTKQDTTPVPSYYPYGGREGHMLALENLGQKKNNRPQNTKTKQKHHSDSITNKRTNTYNPYVGPEGHRMATGNYVRDVKHDTTPAPTYVIDTTTVSNNHQVVTDEKAIAKNVKKTNSNFQQETKTIAQLIGEAIISESSYTK